VVAFAQDEEEGEDEWEDDLGNDDNENMED
jgi:hypothetical protein